MLVTHIQVAVQLLHLLTSILQACEFKTQALLLFFSVNEELKATGKFELMDLHVDEAEHSMEMHLPYLAKVFQG
ncbi:hypothetical protein BHE74_00044558 [Ensete ventricosum]|uniref:Uncharacterized protein n=1 Tax=Ensete ventricosum TaxID=4639 RepID=A0A426XS19_ENSVE|nr:hypothetical protein B296_00057234 [Ensete ventricosum]RWW49308.1 hypothetical protein BHE74_00044558 [Ensete ventricosum]RZS19100.1 hypothetical protein BHM03_00051449 [Ensete ventricosum]